MQNNKKILTPHNKKNYDEQDSIWNSFAEIFTAATRVGVVGAGIYILYQIFILANDLYYCAMQHDADLIQYQIIPSSILLILAMCAFYIMGKD